MIKVVFSLFFLLTCFLSHAQSLSSKVDSLTKGHLILTEQKHRIHFNRLLNLRDEKKLHSRLDSINFDVVLIEENHCLKDSSVNITERYFTYSDTGSINEKSKADSAVLPFLMYSMGISQDVLSHYYSSSTAGMHHYDFLDHYYSLPVLLENYSSLMPVQELTYDTTQPWLGFESQSQFNIAKNEIENKAKQKLKQTYQIVTLIDRRSGKTLVSVQVPPKNPKLELRWVYVSHDW